MKNVRKHVRYRAGYHTIAAIDFDTETDNAEFVTDMSALVTEESKEGLRMVVVSGFEWAPGKKIKIKMGSDAAPVKAEVRWCHEIDGNTIMVGLNLTI